MEANLLGILVGHFLGDLLLQIPYIGRNKGRNYMILILHVFIYTLCLFLSMWLVGGMNFYTASVFAYMNGLMHFLVDRETAPVILKAKKAGDKRRARTYLLLDQTVHMLGFLVTLSIFQI